MQTQNTNKNKMGKFIYTLHFTNDNGDVENYGTFSTRKKALDKIAQLQAQFEEGYETELFDIEVSRLLS